MKKQFLVYCGTPHQWRNEHERRRKRKFFFKKKSFNKQREEKYERTYYNKSSPKGLDFFRKASYYQLKKITISVGHAKK